MFGKQRAMQEIVTGSFSFDITKTAWINSIPDIMAKFMFIQATKIKSYPAYKLIMRMGLCTSKMEFSSVLK